MLVPAESNAQFIFLGLKYSASHTLATNSCVPGGLSGETSRGSENQYYEVIYVVLKYRQDLRYTPTRFAINVV